MFYSDKIKNLFKEVITSPALQKLLHFEDKSIGSILMLHRVDYINENRVRCHEHLKISPEYLESLILELKERQFFFVSLDELYDVLKSKKDSRKLIVFTLDDGYKDNFTNALPIFKKYSVPFTIYIATGMIENEVVHVWDYLNDLIGENNEIILSNNSRYKCKSKLDKDKTFLKIRDKIIKIHPENLEKNITKLFANYNIDLSAYKNGPTMTWGQIKSLKNEPLATIGSHSHSHLDLRYASKEKIIPDINKAKNLLQQKANITPRHFCYPYGNPQKREIDIIKSLNFKTATTAYPGNIYSRHIDNLFNLPRFFVAENNSKKMFTQMLWLKYKNR